MEVILKEDVEHLGFKYDLVRVKNGFGRNYLIPKGFAEMATESKKKEREETLRQRSKKEEVLKESAQKTADLLKDAVITIMAKAGEKGKLFGSITTSQVAEAIQKIGHKIDKRHLSLSSNVKELGTYNANVRLHREVDVDFTFEVKQKKDSK